MAVTTLATLDCCKTLTLSLDRQQNLPQTFADATGMINALKSSANTMGYERSLADMRDWLKDKALPNAGFPVIQLKYMKPNCDVADGDCDEDICTAGTGVSNPFAYANVTVADCVSAKITVSQVDFDNQCNNASDVMAIAVEQAFQQVARGVDVKLILKAEALMGNYFGTTTSSLSAPRTINIINAAGGPNVGAMGIIASQFEQMGASGFTLVGGNILNRYNDAIGVSAPNTSLGVDPTKLRSQNFFFDSRLDSTLTATGCGALAWANGALQMLEAYRYDGVRAYAKEYDVRMVKNYKGIDYDFSMHFDPCGDGVWVIVIKKYFDLFYLPTADYSCLGTGVNMKLQYKLACGAMDCTQLNVC
jgi:hypothetical protein